MTIAGARRRAVELLEEQGICSAPVDVAAMAVRLGVSIVAQPLEESVSGVLVLRGGQAAIGVNEAHPPRRQRFTIAHELGHYLLHRDAASLFVDEGLTFYRDRSSGDGVYQQEIEANAFAAELLMPQRLLRDHLGSQRVDLHDDVAVTRLAAKFGVSVQALTVRLVTLKLASA